MAPESERAMWLVWSAEHQLWWRPNSQGYTDDVKQAGRYTFDKALSICDTRNSGNIYPKAIGQGVPDEIPVPAPEYFDRIRELDAPTEPTLTCSEVVERLLMSANDFKDEYDWKEPHDVTYHAPRAAYSHDELIEFAEAYAKRILHSWRERRVQELPIIENFDEEIALHGGFGLRISQLDNLRAALQTAIGKASYPSNSEQIRKGAKHEG